MGSPIRAGIDGLGRRRPAARDRRPHRAGLLDLLLVAGVLLLASVRTPAGSLARYALARAGGAEATLPSMTAWFDTGAAAPPDLGALEAVAPDEVPEGGIPEPWRTAARTVLAQPPPRVAARARELAPPEAADPLLAALDACYDGDPEAALEILALGEDLRERAIRRARAAGEARPEAYASHARYLPPGAVQDADRVVGGTLALARALDLGWPIQGPHRISSGFGHRMHPVLHTRRFHNGIDLAVPVGTPVYSPQEGTVVATGENAASGRFLVVDHGHGLRTTYCHLSATRVARGARVRRGQHLADSGNTGRSTGPHLHWIVKIAGRAVDPARFGRRQGPIL